MKEKKLHDRWTNKFLSILSHDTIEVGYVSRVEEYIISLMKRHGNPRVFNWLNDMFCRHISNKSVCISILHAMSHMDDVTLYCDGYEIAEKAIAMVDVGVIEWGVRVFENRKSNDYVDKLKAISCPQRWMQDYINKVIEHMEHGQCIDLAQKDE